MCPCFHKRNGSFPEAPRSDENKLAGRKDRTDAARLEKLIVVTFEDVLFERNLQSWVMARTACGIYTGSLSCMAGA